MNIVLRLIKEFGLPFVFSFAWAIYITLDTTNLGKFHIKDFLNVFAPAFFLCSWLLGQIFRIQKQARVENNLSSIENRIESLITNLAQRTDDIIGYATGGNSFIRVALLQNRSVPFLDVAISNMGKYPMYDVTIVVSTPKYEQRDQIVRTYYVGTVLVGVGRTIGEFSLPDHDKQGYVIQIRSRSGHHMQVTTVSRDENSCWVYGGIIIYDDFFNPQRVIFKQE